MSELIPTYNNDDLTIIKNIKDIDKYRPYLREVFLFKTHIAGTSYIENIATLEPNIIEGLEVHFFREPNNQYDKNAIVIKDEKNNKIGYVPKVKNDIISKLMDAGKIIFGRVTEKEWKNKYLKIKINVFFKD